MTDITEAGADLPIYCPSDLAFEPPYETLDRAFAASRWRCCDQPSRPELEPFLIDAAATSQPFSAEVDSERAPRGQINEGSFERSVSRLLDRRQIPGTSVLPLVGRSVFVRTSLPSQIDCSHNPAAMSHQNALTTQERHNTILSCIKDLGDVTSKQNMSQYLGAIVRT